MMENGCDAGEKLMERSETMDAEQTRKSVSIITAPGQATIDHAKHLNLYAVVELAYTTDSRGRVA